MKKILLALLALALFLSACGGPAVEETPTPTPEPTPTQTAEPTPTPEPTPSGPLVYTDWSKLKPYQPATAVYTRRYEGFTDTLIPASDYGLLVPFAGTPLTETWEGWSSDYNLYGLMTLEGEVVADPVFTGAFRLQTWDGMMMDSQIFPVYVLQKAVVTERGPVERIALCALDGSWCTDFLYTYNWENPGVGAESTLFVVSKGEDCLAVLDLTNGRELNTMDLSPYLDDESYFGWQVSRDGSITVNVSQWGIERDIFLVYDLDGSLRLRLDGDEDSILWLGRCEEGLLPATAPGPDPEDPWSGSLCGFMDKGGNWVIDPVYQQVEPFENAVALVREQSGAWRFIDPAGAPVTEPIMAPNLLEAGDCWYFTSDTGRPLAVYDRAGKPVEGIQNLATGQLETQMDGWVTAPAGDEILLAKGAVIRRFPAALGWVNGVCEEGILFCAQAEGETSRVSAVLMDWDGKELSRWEGYSYVYLTQDGLTGEYYLSATWEEGDRARVDYYDLSGNLMVSDRGRFDGYYTFWNGMACWNGGEETTFTDRSGSVIFRWPIHSSMD